MNSDNFFSIDRLVEFGLGIGMAQQMVNSMNHALQHTYIPGTMNAMAPMPARPSVPLFLALDGKPAGPFSEEDVTRLIAQGTVTKATYVWRAGMPNWDLCQNVPEILKLVALCPPPFRPPEA